MDGGKGYKGKLRTENANRLNVQLRSVSLVWWAMGSHRTFWVMTGG